MSTQSQNPPEVGSSLRPIVGFVEDHLRVTPGETERLTLVVRNGSSIVETYEIIVLGPAASWVQPASEQVSLFPGEESSIDIVVSPPRAPNVVSGAYALGVQVMSRVAKRNASTAETTLDVLPFYDFQVITGRNTFNIRTRAKFMVQVSNLGNSTTTFRVSASDPEGYLRPIPTDPEIDLLPGERKWTSVRVKAAPRIFGNAFDTRNFAIFVVPSRDTESGTALTEIAPEEQRGTVLHKPFIRVRLGLLGRLALIIAILALIAAFVVSRLSFNSAPPTQGAPSVPTQFSAKAQGADQVVLTWKSSSGATGYKIYAIGQSQLTATPAPSPSASVSATPARADGTPAVVLLSAATDQTPRITLVGGEGEDSGAGSDGGGSDGGGSGDTGSAGEGGGQGGGSGADGSGSQDPTGGVPQALRPDLGYPTPVCADCTLLTETDAGTTLYTAEKVAAGLQCYRITALGPVSQSLYSSAACTTVVAATPVDINGDGVADGIDTNGDGKADAATQAVPPCRPVEVQAQALAESTVVILWRPATEVPAGWLTPALAAEAKAGADLTKVCDPVATLTGFGLQRQILTGWADVNPGPAADDTAFEVTDLSPGIEYCFRMRSLTAEAKSRYTKKFCAQTLPAAAPSGSPADPSGVTPATQPTASATPAPSGPAPQPLVPGASAEPQLADLPN